MIWKFRVKAALTIFKLAMLIAPNRGVGGIFVSDDGEKQSFNRQFKHLRPDVIDWAFERTMTKPVPEYTPADLIRDERG